MFQSFVWNYAAARVFAKREVPHVIYSENGGGAALIPAAINLKRRIASLMGESMFDYRDVLFAGDERVLASAWYRVAQLRLYFSAGAVRGSTDTNWAEFNLHPFYRAPRVSPKETYPDQFISGHNRLGRWFRRLERMGVEMRCRTGNESKLVRYIYAQKGSQHAENGANLFADPLRQQFMMEVCSAVGNGCEIFTLESGATLVAAIVTFRDRNIRRFYTIYFDMAWGKYSPGMCLLFEVTRRSLAAGMECDYMTGEHAYKMRLATSVVPLHYADATPQMLAAIGQPQPAIAA